MAKMLVYRDGFDEEHVWLEGSETEDFMSDSENSILLATGRILLIAVALSVIIMLTQVYLAILAMVAGWLLTNEQYQNLKVRDAHRWDVGASTKKEKTFAQKVIRNEWVTRLMAQSIILSYVAIAIGFPQDSYFVHRFMTIILLFVFHVAVFGYKSYMIEASSVMMRIYEEHRLVPAEHKQNFIYRMKQINANPVQNETRKDSSYESF